MANSTKVTIDYMMKKDFKKETGYDDLVKKVYEKSKSAKVKGLTGTVSVAKMTFQPGKGKPPVTSITNTKIKQVKKGPVKDKVVVVVTEGEGKKKTRILGIRFANEEDAKTFFDTAKLKGVKEPEPTATSPAQPAASTEGRSMTPPPPLSPSTHSPIDRSRTASISRARQTPSRDLSQRSMTPIVPQRNPSPSSVSSKHTSDFKRTPLSRSPSPVVQPRKIPSARSMTPMSHSYDKKTVSTTPCYRHSSTSSTRTHESQRKTPANAFPEYYGETRCSFVSTDPNDYMQSKGNQPQRRGRHAYSNGKPSYSDAGKHQSRKSVESVRILKLQHESARSSSSRSSSSSSSSSSSISATWRQGRSATNSRQSRNSRYRVNSVGDDYVEFTPSDINSRRRRNTRARSSSSSSLSSSSRSRSGSAKYVSAWRIHRIDSSSSSTSSSSSSSSVSPIFFPTSHGRRSQQFQNVHIITPR